MITVIAVNRLEFLMSWKKEKDRKGMEDKARLQSPTYLKNLFAHCTYIPDRFFFLVLLEEHRSTLHVDHRNVVTRKKRKYISLVWTCNVTLCCISMTLLVLHLIKSMNLS